MLASRALSRVTFRCAATPVASSVSVTSCKSASRFLSSRAALDSSAGVVSPRSLSSRRHLIQRLTLSHTRCYSTAGVRLVESGTYSSPRPSHNCGQLRVEDVGKSVTLTGWLSSHRPMSQQLAFIVLRDGYGSTQVKFEIPQDSAQNLSELLKSTPLESILAIRGKVIARPESMRNSSMSTGDIEIEATEIEILNRAVNVPLPFQRDSPDTTTEESRLRYRYLELRQPYLQRNIRLRSKILQIIRQSLVGNGFNEIETPTLFRKTSEGAKEFLVPTRTPGKFYVLTQSPQQYKQMLMASGFDRYFQVARCYRDENLRADRQPEFTQIDLEMAFIQQEDIMKVIEDLLSSVWREALGHSIQTPLPRRTYRWCMDNYGSDKPDTRYELKLQDVSDVFQKTGVSVLQNKFVDVQAWQGSFGVKAINIVGLSAACNDKEIESIQNEAKLNSAGRGVVMIRVGKNGSVKSSISKYMSEDETRQLLSRMDAHDGDLIMLSAGLGDEPLNLLGKLRVWCANILQQKKLLVIPPDRYDFFWVVDFPLFTWEDGVMAATHHPFTAPVSEDAHLLQTHPERVRGQHYDIVLNGIELGGGSIRIHRAEEQVKVFRDVLKLPASKVDEFSHLIEALSHGCPPHGGIALGLDRLVAQALGAKSLREVLAFPKTGTGAELLTGSPSTLSQTELKDLMDSLKQASASQAPPK